MKTSFIPHFMIKSDTFVIYLPDFSLSKKHIFRIKDFSSTPKNGDEVAKKYKLNLGIHLFLLLKISGRLGFSELNKHPPRCYPMVALKTPDAALRGRWRFSGRSRTRHETGRSAGYTPSGSPKNTSMPKQFPNVFDPKVAFMNSRIRLGVCILIYTCRFQGWWQWIVYLQYLYTWYLRSTYCVLLTSSFCI